MGGWPFLGCDFDILKNRPTRTGVSPPPVCWERLGDVWARLECQGAEVQTSQQIEGGGGWGGGGGQGGQGGGAWALGEGRGVGGGQVTLYSLLF